MLSALSGFVTTLTGKVVLGTAVVATSVGGLHAARVVDVPVLPDPPTAETTPVPAAETDLLAGDDHVTVAAGAGGVVGEEGADAGIVEVDPTDGLGSDELAQLCADAANHGDYVSQVARGGASDDDTYTNHGEFVREAATSDCGNTGGEVVGEEGADAELVEVDPTDGLGSDELAPALRRRRQPR